MRERSVQERFFEFRRLWDGMGVTDGWHRFTPLTEGELDELLSLDEEWEEVVEVPDLFSYRWERENAFKRRLQALISVVWKRHWLRHGCSEGEASHRANHYHMVR